MFHWIKELISNIKRKREFMRAAKAGNLEIIKSLLDSGIDPNVKIKGKHSADYKKSRRTTNLGTWICLLH